MLKLIISEGWGIENSSINFQEISSNFYELNSLKLIKLENEKILSLIIQIENNSSLSLSNLILESNSKFCEVYLKYNEEEEKYFITMKGEKYSIESNYCCSCEGLGVKFTQLRLKCLSLQNNKNELNITKFQIKCLPNKITHKENITTQQTSSNINPFPIFPSPNQFPSPINNMNNINPITNHGNEIGLNFDMTNAFTVYRSIILSDISKLLDDKLTPINNKLNKIENRMDQLALLTLKLSDEVKNSIRNTNTTQQIKNQNNSNNHNDLKYEENKKVQEIEKKQEEDMIENNFEEKIEVKNIEESQNIEEKNQSEIKSIIEEHTIEVIPNKRESHNKINDNQDQNENEEESLKGEMKHLLKLLRQSNT